MTNAKRTTPPAAGRGQGRGFTLVELLIVVAIIGLLVGILVPVVQTALIQAEVARCEARIMTLQASCYAYRYDQGYFPGQRYIDQIGKLDDSKTTGSQWLAKAMFDEDNPYAPYKAEDIFEYVGETSGGGQRLIPDSVSDRFGEPMAVLYFPAKLGADGVGQFDGDHNVDYVYGFGDPSNFSSYITVTRLGSSESPNADAFLLIAPGKDRLYYTGDDIKWPRW